MDINPLNVQPTSSKNSNTRQNELDVDENHATATPFQAMLDNQQPVEKQPTGNQPANEETVNKDIADNKLAQVEGKTLDHVKAWQKNTENAIEQLNFSHHLRTDKVQTVLNADLLLTGKEANEQVWLANLKHALSNTVPTSTTQPVPKETHSALGAFTQSMQQLSHGTNGHLSDEESQLERSLLPLSGEENTPTLGAFIQNEKEERRDQPLFPFENQRDIRHKNLTSDFMPLAKRVSDKEPLSNGPTLTADNLSQNIKSAFSLQSDMGGTVTSSSPHITAQGINLVPTTSTAQAVSMNAPTATPTMHLTSQLGSEAWQQQLSQHMLFFSRQGISQAQIRLHPEELGSLNVHLRIEDNQAVMHFVSPHSHVRAAMESMMPMLRNALQESGIHLAQGSVGQDNLNHQPGDQQQGTAQHDGHIQATHPSVGVVGISEANASVSAKPVISRQGGINTFA